MVALPAYSNEYRAALLRSVEGNVALMAAKSAAEAEQSENMTGLSLPNPEVDFAYQWGSPSTSPDKIVLDVTQSFDFATLSGGKSRVARSRNAVAGKSYEVVWHETAAEVDRVMTNAVYLRKVSALYARNDSLMRNMEQASAARVARGDMTSIDFNAVVMQRRNAATGTLLHDIDEEANLAELDRLSGGVRPEWTPSEYMTWSVPEDFESWFMGVAQNNPVLGVAMAETAAARDEVSLRRKEGLPSFSLGYTSEMVAGDNHYGVKVGVELPLWSNRGRVKAARAGVAAAEARLDDAQRSLRANLNIKYRRALALKRAYEDCIDIRRQCDNSALLDRAFAEGVMPYHEYIAQLLTLLELDKRVLETERDYQLALAELRAAAAIP